ncbi:MAG: DinB family protein [Bryobacteraceae bacterium]|jgi:uncharacterized damage-inducible protein DinB
MSVESLFLNAAAAKLRQFTDQIEVCLGKLSDDQIWARGHENENAVGNLVLHLAGNVRQWIVAGLGGQPDIRVRHREFSTEGGITGAELGAKLRETVDEAAQVIACLTTEQLTRVYEIQNRKTAGLEAVFHVVAHFAEHKGQIVFATKNLTGEDLNLTIPRKKNP